MWFGHPRCVACDYIGPETLWGSVMGSEQGFLIQDEQTLALRAATLPYHPDFARRKDDTDRDFDDRFATRAATELGDQLRPGERIVPVSGMVRVATGTGREPSLLCPGCRVELAWEHTFIP